MIIPTSYFLSRAEGFYAHNIKLLPITYRMNKTKSHCKSTKIKNNIVSLRMVLNI